MIPIDVVAACRNPAGGRRPPARGRASPHPFPTRAALPARPRSFRLAPPDAGGSGALITMVRSIINNDNNDNGSTSCSNHSDNNSGSNRAAREACESDAGAPVRGRLVSVAICINITILLLL